MEQVSTEWVITIDPDMRFPGAAFDRVTTAIESDDRLGIIGFPYRNLFAGKPVRYGRWGGICRHFPAVVNRSRVQTVPLEHRGHFKLLDGFHYLEINPSEGLVMDHYWNESWPELKETILRYIPAEMDARRAEGSAAVGWWAPTIISTRVFLESFLLRKAILDGVRGARFSYLAGWYEWRILRGLRKSMG